MFGPIIITKLALLLPLAVLIIYNDVRYRRIPNKFVLATLIVGLSVNVVFGGFNGVLSSLEGCALAFGLMLLLHIFGAMGAGDVKLFAAVGSLLGLPLVLPAFVVVVMTGGVLAVATMIRAGTVRSSMHNVLMILAGFMPGWKMPKFDVAASDRRATIPYGVAITLGSLIALAFFRT